MNLLYFKASLTPKVNSCSDCLLWQMADLCLNLIKLYSLRRQPFSPQFKITLSSHRKHRSSTYDEIDGWMKRFHFATNRSQRCPVSLLDAVSGGSVGCMFYWTEVELCNTPNQLIESPPSVPSDWSHCKPFSQSSTENSNAWGNWDNS